MEDAKKSLELTPDESEAVSRLVVPEQRAGVGTSVYYYFATTGIRVHRVEPGFVVCSLKVPPRLTDRAGLLANGAIANLVDLVGASLIYVEGLPMNVSVDMSISYLSKAKLDDELEISSKKLGQRGSYSGTCVLVRNKATGEIIAQGRHSLFRSGGKANMEKVNKSMELTEDESEAVSRVVIPPNRVGESSFYDAFALRGIRVDRVEPGLVVCTFNVPPRLTDRGGNLGNGAIANLVDIVGGTVAFVPGLPMNVSVDMSISYISTAKLHDELEITSRILGRIGGCSGTIVILRNKATGKIIAEGRHSLFRSHSGPIPKL